MRFIVIAVLLCAGIVAPYVYLSGDATKFNGMFGLTVSEPVFFYGFGAVVAAIVSSVLVLIGVAVKSAANPSKVDQVDAIDTPTHLSQIDVQESINRLRDRTLEASKLENWMPGKVGPVLAQLQKNADQHKYEAALNELCNLEDKLWDFPRTSSRYKLFLYLNSLRDSLNDEIASESANIEQKADDTEDVEDDEEEVEEKSETEDLEKKITEIVSKLASELSDAFADEHENDEDSALNFLEEIKTHLDPLRTFIIDKEYREARLMLGSLETTLIRWKSVCEDHYVFEKVEELQDKLLAAQREHENVEEKTVPQQAIHAQTLNGSGEGAAATESKEEPVEKALT